MLLLCACLKNAEPGSPDVAEPTQTEDAFEGFDLYENEEYGFSLRYPPTWSLLDGAMSDEQLQTAKDALVEAWGEAADQLISQDNMNELVAIWYDFGNMSNGFVPNINLTIAEQQGMSQQALKSTANQKSLQDEIETMYFSIVPDFKPYGDIEGKTFGTNYFLVYQYEFFADGIGICGYQAITAKSGECFIFTLTAGSDKITEAIPIYEKILSSLEL